MENKLSPEKDILRVEIIQKSFTDQKFLYFLKRKKK